MAKPLTFGVELEFLVARGPAKGKEPELESGKEIRFPVSAQDKSSTKPRSRSVYRHIVSTLQNSGFTAALKEKAGAGDYTLWGVKGDSTVSPPTESPWEWVDAEVVSPILALNEENLEVVRKVCKLIRDTYKYDVPKSSALHVHIGDRDLNFSFETVQKLILFLWAFEPQLNTIHPPWRIDTMYANSIRNKSGFAEEWFCKYGERPSTLQALVALKKYKTMEEICDVASFEIAKYGAYNFRGVKAIAGGRKIGTTAFATPTVEFRQHMGTLDGEAVITWIKAVAGIMDFAKNTCPETLDTLLLSVARHETWERFGNAEDTKKEQELGFTLAEGSFTAVDLFRYMGLNDCADYYEEKMYNHTFSASLPRDDVAVFIRDGGDDIQIMAKNLPKLLRTWHFEQDTALNHESAAYAELQSKRDLWEAWKRHDIFLTEEGRDGVTIDLDSDFWPPGKTTTIVSTPLGRDYTI